MRSVESVKSDGWQEYRFGPGWTVTQVWPATCKNGHPFVPGRGQTGWSVPCIRYHCGWCDSVLYLTPRPVEWLIARSLAQAIADGVVGPDYRLAGFSDVNPVLQQ